MRHADWHAALLAEPTDDLVRLAFADWLDERGETDRAEYVRLGVERGRVGWQPYGSAGWQEGRRLDGLVRAAFERCRPVGWGAVTGVKGEHDRGLAELAPGSPTALARLGKVGWLPGAVAGGWLAPVFVWNFHSGWVKALAAAWSKGLDAAALKATGFLLGADSSALLLAHPKLHTLYTDSFTVRPYADAATGCSELRDLSISLSSALAGDADAALAFARGLPGLRRMSANGDRDRPTDADVLTLAGVPGLRELIVHHAPAVTAAGVTAARAASPHLTVVYDPAR